MDPAVELHELIVAGREVLNFKYFFQAIFALVIWDHLIMFSDEVEYVWKKEKTWLFWLYIMSRYSILLCKTWLAVATFWPGYTQEVDVNSCERSSAKLEFRCNRTVKLGGYYYVFILTLSLIFLTMRVYALTEKNKYILVVSGTTIISSLATGLWFVSVPSAKAIQMPNIPLDAFRACIFLTPGTREWAYRSQVALADVVAFTFLVVSIFRLKADRGQTHMNQLMRTILQDGTYYFLVMAAFHMVMLVLTTLGKTSSYPPIVITALTPILICRLVVSLRKSADASLVQVWNGDHFSAVDTASHEMMDFARPPPRPSTSFVASHASHGNSRWSSYPDLPNPYSEP